MDIVELERRTRAALDQARDSLARIEMHVRETGDAPHEMEASRLYARFCMHAREFVTLVQMRRPSPRRFALQIQEARAGLAGHWSGVEALGLHPTPGEFAELAAFADSVPERA